MNNIRTVSDQQLRKLLEEQPEAHKKHERQSNSVGRQVRCVCGNIITIGPKTQEFHCYKCGKFNIWFNGKWKRQQHVITKDTMTIANGANITFKSLRRNKEALKKMGSLIINIQRVK